MRVLLGLMFVWLLAGCAAGGGAGGPVGAPAATPTDAPALLAVTPRPTAAATANAATATAASARYPDAPYMAGMFGISLEEAQRRLALAEAVNPLAAAIPVDHPDTFAGLWLEQEPEFKLVVAFTRDAEATLRPYVAGTPLEGIAEARTLPVSYAALQQTQQELAYLFDLYPGVYSSDIDIKGNRVVFDVDDPAAFLAAVAAAGIELPPAVIAEKGEPIILE